MDTARYSEDELQSVAIIGMAGRFPGADDLEAFWRNLVAGIESVQTLGDSELRALGVPPELLADPRYVKRASRLSDVQGFDAEFFDFNPREAQITDPQHRLLLECAYVAIEHAGYNPYALDGVVGVYAGVGLSDYLLANIATQPDFLAGVDGLQLMVGNDKSYACTRISHKLGLQGPSVAVDTACSTSLVAVHLACKALLMYECDLALAGGAKVAVPQGAGYMHQPGGILSPDGSCRPFDASAAGTLHGSGVGMVLLKRLVDALQDGDTIHAVIRGSAINNDGKMKVGYTAPGVQGQVRVIAQAQAVANVDPASIGYVEAHGTGTSLGDPIEVMALTQAFRERTPASGYCALGSLKGNIGHLDVAAGIAGLIKTTLALKQRTLPPSLGYRRANPEIRFADTPFFVNAGLADWAGPAPRRAGVSSFGIGGTNAHVVLEEAPAVVRAGNALERPQHLLRLSARDATALAQLRVAYANFLAGSDAPLGDIAYTANVGRPQFEHRLVVVGTDALAMAAALRQAEDPKIFRGVATAETAGVAFLFSGQGAQYAGMGRELYAGHPSFRRRIDELSGLMHGFLSVSLPDLLWGERSDLLAQTRYTQPALFALELALAELWCSFGVHPTHLIGHSVGEVAAACHAGVFSLADGIRLICTRAALMDELAEPGEMLAVALGAEPLLALLGECSPRLALAADNGPQSCVAAGTSEDIATLCELLQSKNIAFSRLPMTRAFHSAAMQPVLERFRVAIADLHYAPPSLPIVSNLSGRIDDQRLATPDYWVDQIRQTVQFRKGMLALDKLGLQTFVEIGPKSTLVKLGRGCLPGSKATWLPSLDGPGQDWTTLLGSIARLHVAGGRVDWRAFDAAYERRRVSAPTYPFQRKPHWCLPDAELSSVVARPVAANLAVAAAAVAPVAANTKSDSSESSPLHAQVSALWSELLGVSAIRGDDDFFTLGGHSLLVVQLGNRVEREFGFAMPMNALIENPTLDEFAATIAHLQCSAVASVPLPQVQADAENRYAPFPLVGLQQAFLLGRSDAFGLGGVSTHLYFELTPALFDPERFDAAWNALVRRHDMLRAVIIDENEQRVLAEVPEYLVRRYDLHESLPALPAHLDRLRHEMSHQVMPADRFPLFDVRVTRESDTRYRVHISMDLLMLDVRSNQILFRDLDLLYLGQEQALPALPISYRDYVLVERELLAGARHVAARKYWLDRLPNLPLAPNLPLVVNPSELRKPHFSRRIAVLDPQQWHQLRKKSQGMGITPSALLMTAYGLVIARWSKGEAFTLNLTMFNRQPLHDCVNQLVGDFTTLSLLGMDYSGALCLKERARRVQRQLWADLEHRSFGGVDVLRELSRHHGGGQQITMPVVFTSALPLDEDNGRELPPESLFNALDDGYSISQTPQVWIDHVVSEEGGHLLLSWDAIDDLFPAGMLDEMFGAYETLVRDLAARDEPWRATHLDLLPARQRDLRDAANATQAPHPRTTLPAMIHARALATPQRIAVIAPDIHLDYATLYDLASQWASELAKHAVQPNELVAVIMEKGWEQVVATLAIQLAGAAYMPVDARLPEDRQRQLLQLGKPRIALAQPWLAAQVAQLHGLEVLALTALKPASHTPAAPAIRSDDDLAYVLFTSGSTGTPKGVMIDHRSATNTMLDIIERYRVTADDRALAVSSLSFDLSVFDMFGLLAAGGSLVVPRPDEVKDPAALDRYIDTHGVTLLNTVPALVEMLVDRHEVVGTRLPASLRLIMMGGDFIPVSLPQRIWALAPQAQLESMGGPTETAIYSIAFPIVDVDPHWPSIPYGKALRNRSCHVLDNNLDDKPEWVAGEIYIGSDDFLARGYWQDAERTLASFVHHPASGERLFKTGDLGRYLPDGNIEILGRCDFQVKIHGYRVELGEIESVVARDPRVRRAVVAAKEVQPGSKQVVAYLLRDASAPDAHTSDAELIAALRRRCTESLPDYMVPSCFVVLEELPLNPNGKVDRRALPTPDVAALAIAPFQAPRDELEQRIADIWIAVLDLERLSVFDNFLDVGGHSLVAARVVTRLREALDLQIAIRDLFDHPTVAGLAAHLRQQQDRHEALPRLLRRAERAAMPLSYAQRRLWFIDRFERETAGYAAAYNMPLVLQLRGTLDAQALREAVAAILERHDILRTEIREIDGVPVQAVAADVDLPWRSVEAPRGSDVDVWCERAVADEIARPFDLAQAPALRGVLLRRSADDHVLVLSMHHIVTDAWSVGLMLRELQSLYRAGVERSDATLPALALQYADYASWQQQVWEQGLMRAHEIYWLEELAQLPAPLALPTDFPRRQQKSYFGKALAFEIDSELATAIDRYARGQGATPFMLFMAAFNLLLHRYTGATDLLVGTDAANRAPEEAEHLLGFFINQLVIRTAIDPAASTQDLLASVRGKTLKAYEHEAMPFDRLVDQLRLPRDPGTTPLFQVKLNMHTVEATTIDLPQLQVDTFPIDFATVQYDLVLTIQADGDGYFASLQYKSALFDARRIQQVAEHYLQLLRAMLATPLAPVAELDYLGKSARGALLAQSQVLQNFPQTLSLDQRFAQQAAQHPDAIALSGARRMSYAELAQAADNLAAWLIARVGIGERVGLYLERGENQVIAILAVLKAGASYVPLDPHSPAERIALILDDCAPALILSDRATLAEYSLPGHAPIAIDDLSLQAPSAPIDRARPELPAYVIYTSGTTGKPNGVVITHAHVGRLLDACQGHYGFGRDDVWTLFHSYVFDFSVWEIWGALCYGGRLVVVPYWVSRAPDEFWPLLQREGVTVLNQTPSAFRQLARVALLDDAAPPPLRYVIFGGEGLELQSLRPWFDRYGDTTPQLVNMYGITETTVHVTLRPLSLADLDGGSVIGEPIADLSLYLLDARMQPVPAGVDGEIYVGGAGASTWYLNRPALTARRFVPDPYSSQPGARLYRTGDLARRTVRGDLEYIGRIDHQIKIRGHRVEIGEIESAIARHAGVAEVLVTSSQDAHGHALLAAYVVARAGADFNTGLLKRWLHERLPDYMVPAAFVALAAFPLTINGKIDRRALPAAELAERGAAGYVAPNGEVQGHFATMLASLLSLERVGMLDNFFEIGGHSLLATQLVAHIRDVFGVEVGLRAVFENPTVLALAGLVETGLLAQRLQAVNEAGGDVDAEREEFLL